MPLVPMTDAEARELTNTPATQIYDQILKDLDEAAAVLPSSYTGDRHRPRHEVGGGLRTRRAPRSTPAGTRSPPTRRSR